MARPRKNPLAQFDHANDALDDQAALGGGGEDEEDDTGTVDGDENDMDVVNEETLTDEDAAEMMGHVLGDNPHAGETYRATQAYTPTNQPAYGVDGDEPELTEEDEEGAIVVVSAPVTWEAIEQALFASMDALDTIEDNCETLLPGTRQMDTTPDDIPPALTVELDRFCRRVNAMERFFNR